MKKRLNFLFLCFILPLGLSSQEKVSVTMENVLINELFDVIEHQTNFRIYCNPQDVDSLRVSVNSKDKSPIAILQEALTNTPYAVSVFGSSIFILKDKYLITSLPESYSLKEEGQAASLSGARISQGSHAFALSEDKEQKLVIESRIYEIGNSSRPKTGRVNLSGLIVNDRTGEPMDGLSITLGSSSVNTTTDSKGRYSIQVSTGRQELNLKGYNIKPTKVQLIVYSAGELDFSMEEFIPTLDEIIVASEKKTSVYKTTMGVERIELQKAKNIPSILGEVDVIKVIMSLPGVKSVGEAASGFNVRGGATDQNLILFNDATIYNPSHLFGLFSVFNSDLVSDMELYKSSIPAKYGGRISSVLDINGKEGSKDKLKGSASIGLLTSKLTIEGPIVKDKTSFIVGGRATYSDWMLNLLDDKSGYKDGSAGFYDLNASIHHKFSDRSSIQANGYYSNDDFSFTTQQKYAYHNANGSLKWKRIFSDKLVGSFAAGYNRYDYTTRDTEQPISAYTLGFSIDQGFGKADFTMKLGDFHTLDFGISGIYYDLNQGEYKPHGDESIVAPDKLQREKAIEAALYLSDQWDITSELSVNVGVRYSLFGVLGPRTYNMYGAGDIPSLATVTETVTKNGLFKTYHNPEFRVSGRYIFTNGFSIKAGVNTMSQYIHKISNTTIMSPTDTWKLSDANIKPQKGMQVGVGLYKNFYLNKNLIETSIEGYYKTMDDYLDYRSGAELVMNHHLETDVIETKGKAYGIELMAKKAQGKLNGWVSYTYSRTKLRQDNSLVKYPVNNGDWYSASFDKPHEFKLVGNYKFTHRISFSMNCDYSTGRPVTLPVSKYIFSGGEYVAYSQRNQYRIPDYFRIDASLNIEPSHNLTLLTHSSISLGVYNITGRKNAYSVYYVAEEGKLKGYRLSIFGAPIPYIAYNIKF